MIARAAIVVQIKQRIPTPPLCRPRAKRGSKTAILVTAAPGALLFRAYDPEAGSRHQSDRLSSAILAPSAAKRIVATQVCANPIVSAIFALRGPSSSDGPEVF
jgi:hypothetical protein